MTTEPNTVHPPTGPQAADPSPATEPNNPVPPPAAEPTKPTSPLLFLALGAAGGALVAGVGTALALTADFSGSPFPDAVADCGQESNPHADLSDDGRTLMLDHQGQDESRGLTYDVLDCILTELEVPASVWHEMEKTRALDGRQSASWDGIEASWSYHPDTGLDVVLTRP